MKLTFMSQVSYILCRLNKKPLTLSASYYDTKPIYIFGSSKISTPASYIILDLLVAIFWNSLFLYCKNKYPAKSAAHSNSLGRFRLFPCAPYVLILFSHLLCYPTIHIKRKIFQRCSIDSFAFPDYSDYLSHYRKLSFTSCPVSIVFDILC